MNKLFTWSWGTFTGIILISSNSSYAQSISANSIIVDDSLGSEKSVLTTDFAQNKITITEGSTRGNALFHSFLYFNVNSGERVFFLPGPGIQNIVARVTGTDISRLSGTLGVEGEANLFFINPNGIRFENGSKLDLNGSFLSATADSLIFDNFEFSSSSQKAPPATLKLSIPIGLQFGRTPGSIINEAKLLQVKPGNFIGLIGGEVFFNGAKIIGPKIKIEVGSVTANSLISIVPSQSNWDLGYEKATGFQDIHLLNPTNKPSDQSGFATSDAEGSINLWGRNIELIYSQMSTNNSESLGSNIFINSSESLSLDRSSLTTGVINPDLLQNTVAGDININTKQLIIKNQSSIDVSADTDNEVGRSGNVMITANNFIKIFNNSNLSAQSFDKGDAGNITLRTEKLFLYDGGQITSSSGSSGKGGNIDILDSQLISILGNSDFNSTGLFATSNNLNGGIAGNINLRTEELNILNSGEIKVSSEGQGSAGNIEIHSGTILLENSALLEATTNGDKGNILINSDKLFLRNNSLINVSATNGADGGNIIIDTAILLALSPTGVDGSDIKAKAIGGTGGKITINSQGVFGIQQRKAAPGNQTNDIDASSQFGQSGQVQINTTTDPSQGIVELPATVVDPTTLVAQNPCRQASSSEFTRSGRGGLPPSLSQDLSGESTQVGLVEPANLSAAKPEAPPTSTQVSLLPLSSSQIAPAKGWVYNDKGEVVLVAYNSAVTGPQRLQSDSKGCPVF
jgi:filamentous hemagglutinin family protein